MVFVRESIAVDEGAAVVLNNATRRRGGRFAVDDAEAAGKHVGEQRRFGVAARQSLDGRSSSSSSIIIISSSSSK